VAWVTVETKDGVATFADWRWDVPSPVVGRLLNSLTAEWRVENALYSHGSFVSLADHLNRVPGLRATAADIPQQSVPGTVY